MGFDRRNKLVGLVRFDDCRLEIAPLALCSRQPIEQVKRLLTCFDNLFRFPQALDYPIDFVKILGHRPVCLQRTVKEGAAEVIQLQTQSFLIAFGEFIPKGFRILVVSLRCVLRGSIRFHHISNFRRYPKAFVKPFIISLNITRLLTIALRGFLAPRDDPPQVCFL